MVTVTGRGPHPMYIHQICHFLPIQPSIHLSTDHSLPIYSSSFSIYLFAYLFIYPSTCSTISQSSLGGGFKYFLFSPRSLGKWSNLTSIFFRWVGKTTNYIVPILLPQYLNYFITRWCIFRKREFASNLIKAQDHLFQLLLLGGSSHLVSG